MRSQDIRKPAPETDPLPGHEGRFYGESHTIDRDWELDLLAAERRGRAIALLQNPGPGSTWRISATDTPEGCALLAAARLGARFGATVSVQLASPAQPDRVWSVLAESARLQGLVVAEDARYNRLVDDNPHGGSWEVYPQQIPDPVQAWRFTLGQSHLFVREAAADSPQSSVEACRRIDARAIGEFGVPGLCLMENASISATAVAMDMLHTSPGKTVIVTGGGNNAGDGFAMARGLWELGLDVEVAFLKPAHSLKGDAAANVRLLTETTGVRTHHLADSPDPLVPLLSEASLIVDALLGTGFKGALSPGFRMAIDSINASDIQTLAIDLPSGLDGDTGEVRETAVRSSRTVTFATVKSGLLGESGPAFSGKLFFADIGAPSGAFGQG